MISLVPLPAPRSTSEYLDHGVSGAIALGVEVGRAVAHPDDPITHLLVAIDGEEAVCENGLTGEEIRFSVAECFNPNHALRISVAAKHQDILTASAG